MRLHYSFLLSLLILFPSCRKQVPAAKPSRGQKEEASLKLSQDREALNAFAAALRKVFEWQHAQPSMSSPTTVKELTVKLQAVPAKGLPEDLKQAWEAMLQHWALLSDAVEVSTRPADLQKIQAKGRQAADALNRLLDEQGLGELHF